MKVIQLRGTNACGKTTTVRQFISRGEFAVKTFKDIDYHWEEKRRIAIIGRYDTCVSGGVDGKITNKNILRDTIVRMCRILRPETLIFEGIVYGVTYQFAYELALVLRRIGYDYIGICLTAPLQTIFDRLSKRNGGKPVDYMSVQNKWFSSQRAYERLNKSGVAVKMIEVEKIPENEMWRIISENI